MKLISLYAVNFKKLNFEKPLRFSDGVTVISGPNEAGKSTILDAVLYALYARVTRPPGRPKDEDLLAYNKAKAAIILEFAVGERIFRITREIRRSGTNKSNLDELLGGDSWKPVAMKSRDVTSAVIALLGDISYDELVSSTVVAQKDLGRLVQHETDRGKVINAFLHLESFNEATEDLNEVRKNIEGTTADRPGQLNVEREKLRGLDRDLAELKRRDSENQKTKTEVENLQVKIAESAPKYNELQALHTLLSSYDSALDEKQKVMAQISNQEEALVGHKKATGIYEKQIQDAKTELAKYSDLSSDQEVENVSKLAKQLNEADAEVKRLEGDIATKTEELQPLQKELQNYDRKEIESTRKTKQPVLPYALGTAIAFAGTVLTILLSVSILPWILAAGGFVLLLLLARNISAMGKLAERGGLLAKFGILDARARDLQGATSRLSEVSVRRDELTRNLQVSIDALPRYAAVAPGEGQSYRADAIVKQFSQDAASKKSVESNLSASANGLAELKRKFDEEGAVERIANLKHKAESIAIPTLPQGVEFSKPKLKEIGEMKETVGKGLEGDKSTIKKDNELIADNELYLSQHTGLDSQVFAERELIANLERRLKVIKVAVGGINKTAEARRVHFKPGVEAYMGEILPSLTLGRYKAVMLDENFSVQVFDHEAGEYRPREVFSGGTEDQILLSMRLAFALALMPEVKGVTSQFLWLDEPLGSSDEARRSGIVDYINSNLSKMFAQVFVVSHVGGLEELVPSVVRLDNGKPSG